MVVLLKCLCCGSDKESSSLGPMVEVTLGLCACFSAALHRAVKPAWVLEAAGGGWCDALPS